MYTYLFHIIRLFGTYFVIEFAYLISWRIFLFLTDKQHKNHKLMLEPGSENTFISDHHCL